MSDNLRRYRAIWDALAQGYPGHPTGTMARQLLTLAALISGIVASQRTQLPHMAATVPDGTKPESRVKRFARWIRNDHLTAEGYCIPYAKLLVRHLALQTLVLGDGWQCRGAWLCRSHDPWGLYRSSMTPGVAGA